MFAYAFKFTKIHTKQAIIPKDLQATRDVQLYSQIRRNIIT